jgi:cytochrome c peroxidase
MRVLQPSMSRQKCWATFLFSLVTSTQASIAFSAEISPALGLPAVVYPANNPASAGKVELGKKLFFDKRLSRDNSISCSTCHVPEKAFSDGKPLAEGIGKQIGTRNAPSLLNVAFNTSQFWDGRRPTLEAQALDPLLNPREHGLQDYMAILKIVREDAAYARGFRASFSMPASAIQMEQVTQAIATFERSLIAGSSPFDRAYYSHEPTAISESAERGFGLFNGRAQCSTCHLIGRADALFTDNQFHSLSVGLKKISGRLDVLTTRLVQARQSGASLDETILSQEDLAELGRFAVTLNPADIGKFRTPSLRNAALTAPYMHDGSVATLEAAVEMELYSRGTAAGRPMILTPMEKSDLVEFLRSLTSPLAQNHMAPD